MTKNKPLRFNLHDLEISIAHSPFRLIKEFHRMDTWDEIRSYHEVSPVMTKIYGKKGDNMLMKHGTFSRYLHCYKNQSLIINSEIKQQ